MVNVTGKRNCASNVCFNGGNCIVDDEAGVFQCECRPGFSGTLCESALPCSLDCQNGGLCSFDSSNNEKCECPEG
uniref:EGF-like domain-containing protein n=1 Tax=Panagrolaimus davidi TaxID=227884 RepID=A0A914P4Q3_9BILA